MTGWICYHICDKSGSGWNKDKWIYEPWLCEEGEDEIREHIVNTRESWAVFAERYSFEVFVGQTPPREIIEREIKIRENKIQSLRDSIDELKAQL